MAGSVDVVTVTTRLREKICLWKVRELSTATPWSFTLLDRETVEPATLTLEISDIE
jgi:hypothetical protein